MSVEDQLHTVGTPQVDVLPDDLLEQHPALHGPVENPFIASIRVCEIVE